MANYLPRTVSKSELARYWGVSLKKVWSDILTPELLSSWGYDYEMLRHKQILNPKITLKIYQHFDIVDLNETVEEHLERIRLKEKNTKAERLSAALRL